MSKRSRRPLVLTPDGKVPNEKPIRVAICVPCHDEVKAMFSYDLAQMVGATSRHPEIELSIVFLRGTLIAGQREKLAVHAVNDGATHILWLDSDMRFPPDTLLRLMMRDQPIVGANYTTRRPPIKFVALARHTGSSAIEVVTDEFTSGIQSVEFTGMGVMLTATDVFRSMDHPWFLIEYMGDASGGHESGEDVFFCRFARASGYPVFIDHDLSKEVRHMGELEFEVRHVDPERITRIRAADTTSRSEGVSA